MPRQLVLIVSLLLTLSFSACAGFDKGAGRAANNASDALGLLWGKGGAKSSSSARTRGSVSAPSSSPKKKTVQGAVSPAPSEDDVEEEETSLGGMERPGAR